MDLKSNVVIQTAFLGDLILSIPVLRRIKVVYPQDKLIVICKRGFGEFLIKEHIGNGCYQYKLTITINTNTNNNN